MKKRFLLLTFLFCLITPCFAMPGFNPYIQDKSGEFVYYRDYTFSRESYIGILEYSESEYQIKYYAPAIPSANLPEKTIALLIKINPKKNYMEFTGETTLKGVSNNPEDIDIMNYLHDILYEFSSRRIKMENVSPSNPKYVLNKDFYKNGITVSDEYEQFGGKVKIVYDCIIPFFNIKLITDSSGKTLLECATIGCLDNNSDKTFDNFKPVDLTTIPTKLEKLNSKAKAKKVNFDGANLTLTDEWQSNSENFYTFKDESVAILSTVNVNAQDTDFVNVVLILCRTLISSSKNNITNFKDISFIINDKAGEVKILLTHYNELLTKEAIILKADKTDKSKIHYLGLITTYYAYSKRVSYYEKILKSYKLD